MITLIATAAILSCGEAQSLIDRVNPEYFTHREYHEIVRVIRDGASPHCDLITGVFPTFRDVQPVRRAHWDHPGVRPGWQPPSIIFNYAGEPTLTFRF